MTSQVCGSLLAYNMTSSFVIQLVSYQFDAIQGSALYIRYIGAAARTRRRGDRGSLVVGPLSVRRHVVYDHTAGDLGVDDRHRAGNPAPDGGAGESTGTQQFWKPKTDTYR